MEAGNPIDPYSVAWHNKNMEVVGHAAREISRHLHFFMKRGGMLTCNVTNKARKRSPIEQGGLEIHIRVTASHLDDSIIIRLKSLLTAHSETYSAPVRELEVPAFHSRISTSKKTTICLLSSDDDEPVIQKTKRHRVMTISSDSE